MNEQAVHIWDIIIILVYLLLVAYLGWLGYRRTQTTTDYMVAGRKAHPFIMAMSYGATFISTSAIVGFGGVAGLFGMSLLWLTFLNIFVGIFIAFVVLGGPTRRMGHQLDAHTFPELLGRRYNSKSIQVFAGLIIFLFMPLYAAAVLMGGAEFIRAQFHIDFNTALLIFAVIVAAYVIAGGLKAVMYTDALQGTIMAVGMIILLVYGYSKVGGIVAGHQALTDLADMVPAKLKDMGHQGWTAMPAFGWGAAKYDMWWTVITTIVMGVGIGVLAQPQLAVRFMTVKSKRELNRAVATGGVFILLMTGVAFTVGALSNAYFALHGPLMTGRIVKTISTEKNHVVLQLMKEDGGKWIDVEGKQAPVVLDKDKPYLDAGFDIQGQTGKIAQGRSISVVYAKGSSDQIIPTYITSALPKWFGIVFLLTLLAAAMSTLSSQFHTLGTGIGRDVYEQISGRHGKSVGVIRIGIILGLILAVSFSTYARSDYIIARATSIFFGLCASTFLPTFVAGLFFRRATKAGALASMIVGSLVTVFWLVFVKAQEASAIGLVQRVTGGKTSILWNYPNWPVVDQLLIALPLSVLVLIVVSIFTRPPDGSHMAKCFAGGAADKRFA